MGFSEKLGFRRPDDEVGASWVAILMGFFVAFGGVLYGYDTGTISGIMAMPFYKSLFSTGYRNANGELDITASQEAAIVSILSAGTLVGALASPLLADRWGRRPALMISTWVFNLGVVLQTLAEGIPLFIAGRFFAGVGVGLISALIPLYQSETAPKWIRGAIVGAYQLAITIGLLLAAVVNNATAKRPDSGSYRIPIAVQFAWSLVLFAGMLFLPETPRFLVRSGQLHKAKAALSRIRRLDPEHEALAAELGQIRANLEAENSVSKATYADCFRRPMLKRQFTGMALQALQQLTGINFIFYYGTRYFQNSGVSSGFTIALITSGLNVFSTIPGLLAIDRWGRRPLLLLGAVGMCAAQLVVACCGTLSTGQRPDGEIFVKSLGGQQAAVAFVCVFIFFFASTWGPLAWVVTGELYPLRIRAKALSMTTATNWLLNWAIAYSTPYLVNYGPGYANLQSKIFFVWSGACFLCIALAWFFIYETKGLSLEEVDELYAEVKVARKSASWKPTQPLEAQVPGSASRESKDESGLKEAKPRVQHERFDLEA
ncbi:general substrate transporter [Trichoderma novae-zelandiae]